MMRCKKIEGLLIAYIDKNLDKGDVQKVDKHLSSCAACRTEFEYMRSMNLRLSDMDMEEPPLTLKKNIDNMIKSYILGINNSTSKEPLSAKISNWIETWWPRRPLNQFITTSAVLVAGVIIGLIFNRNHNSNRIDQLGADVNDLKRVIVASMFNQTSVSDRVNGLAMSSQLKNVDQQFLSTLLLLLNTDSNVNVRIAAVNAIANFSRDEYVRQELIKSLNLQSSPLVQISLINLLVEIKEHDSSSALLKIINDPNTNDYVKNHAEQALKKLT
jgi:hypothetical protein